MKPTPVQQIDEWRAAKSETEHLEFKEARNNFKYDELLRYCVAIGNEGGGFLLLGIQNKPPRRVVGTSTYPNINKITEQLLNKLRFRVDVEEVNHPEGRVVVFHIPSRPSQQAFSVDGAYYMRSGESLVAMTPDQLKKIFSEPSAERREASPPNPNKRRLGAALLVLACVAAVSVIGYGLWPSTPKLHNDTRSVNKDGLGTSGSTTSTTEAQKSKLNKTGAPGPKPTKPRPPQFAELAFSFYVSEEEKFPQLSQSVRLHPDHSVDLEFFVKNISDDVAAERGDVFMVICLECNYMAEPIGFQKLAESQESTRHRTFEFINPSLSLEPWKVSVMLPWSPPFSFDISFRYECQTCGPGKHPFQVLKVNVLPEQD